ncbi:MAG: hypothetical protein KC493_05585 [Bacteriovoracaceae bacterium]|nr:hypothetical protein [Bacteriovoracaceae bacterium]
MFQSRPILRVLSIFLIFFARSYLAHAQAPEEELQEVRFAKAELALIDGNEKEAMQILKKNINRKHFHLPSYELLADYHFRHRNFSKGMRVYHYLIKKLHSDRVLTSPLVDNISNIIDDLPAPNQDVLKIYFKTGMEYFRMSENPDFEKVFRKKLLLFAQKYFHVIEYYKFNLPQTKYMLGIIKNRREDFFDSIKYLADAKDMLKDLPDKNKKESDLSNLDYLMGDNLVRAGFTDSGSLYLKSVYLSKNADKSLKDYASTYLNAISSEFFSISFRYSYNYNNNIEELSESEQATRDRFSSFFPYIKDAYYSTWGVNLFYNSKKFGHWSHLIYFDVENKNMNNKEQSTNDERTITGSVESKYDNFKKSTLKFALTYAYSMYRSDTNVSLEKLSNFYSFQISYLYTLKRGIITYRIPYNINQSISEGNLMSYGAGVSYSPFIKNKYWGLSYSLDYSKAEESRSSPLSTSYSLGITNSTSINDTNTLFTTLGYTTNQNTNESSVYSQYSIDFSHTLSIPKIRGLSFNINLSYESTNYKTKDEPVEVITAGGGLSYSF